MQQRMALPASALLHLLPSELEANIDVGQVEFLLRIAPDVRETSPGMFKWQGAGDLPVMRQPAEDLSAGASIAKIVARFPPHPSEVRRTKFKRLAALKRLRDFDRLEVARDSMTRTVDRLAQSVLQREGWRVADAVGFATDGSLVPLSRDSVGASRSERRELLVGILALQMLVEFSSVDKSYEELRRELVCHNLALVARVARNRATGRFPQYADLFQSGVEGLYAAIDRYDPYLGYEFSTYATHWIRQMISRTVANQERIIRLPVHAVETLDRIRTSEINLFSRLGREPSIKELANEAKLTVDQVVDLTRRGRCVTRISHDMLEGLHDPWDEIEAAETGMASAEIDKILENVLTRRERQILERRFGLGRHESQTLEVIGQAFGVTRERIRQIESQALKKLRGKAGEPLHSFY